MPSKAEGVYLSAYKRGLINFRDHPNSTHGAWSNDQETDKVEAEQ